MGAGLDDARERPQAPVDHDVERRDDDVGGQVDVQMLVLPGAGDQDVPGIDLFDDPVVEQV